MKKILLIFLLSVFYINIFSQTNGKLWGGLEIAYGLSLSDKGEIYKYSYEGDTKMSMSSIRGVVGYYFLPQMSLGLGIGLNSYTKPSLNTLPVWLDMRYHPVTDNYNFVLNGGIGYSMLTSEEELKGKFLADISVGYKVLNIEKVSIVPAVGYNFCNYSLKDTRLGQSRHSLFFKVGICY